MEAGGHAWFLEAKLECLELIHGFLKVSKKTSRPEDSFEKQIEAES